MIVVLIIIVTGILCTFVIAVLDQRRANDELAELERWKRAMKALQ